MNKNDYIIRNEEERDYFAVENLTREAFWNVSFPGCNEHYFIHVMRNHKDFIKDLAFVVEKDNEIIGNVMYTTSELIDEQGNVKQTISFGPISVHPRYQRMGISRLMLEHSFEKAKELVFDVIVIFGNPDNYVGRGFRSCKKYNVCLEGGNFPTALLVKELKEGALDGRRYFFRESTASAPCEDEKAVEEFDRLFPEKEKKWQPSQEEFYIHSHSTITW
ncbi:MAG: N-acetyltransferase [Oscillospiraceae bacterium]|nr:N-acetyltransferase [Oscillospiraceae bacterium]